MYTVSNILKITTGLELVQGLKLSEDTSSMPAPSGGSVPPGPVAPGALRPPASTGTSTHACTRTRTHTKLKNIKLNLKNN